MAAQGSAYSFVPPTLQSRKAVRGSLVFWLRFLGIAAFLIILLRLPKAQEVRLAHIDLRWLGFCMALTICQLLLDAFIWQQLLTIQRIRHPYPKTLQSFLSSQYLGMVTPGHVGEFLAAGYISVNTGITFGYALSSVVMRKALHWIVLVGFGAWGVQLLLRIPLKAEMQGILLMSAALILVLSAGIAVWIVSIRRLARKWEKLSPWQIDMTEFWFGFRHLLSVKLAGPFLASLAAFSLLFLQLAMVLRALGIVLPLPLVAQIMALSRIVARAVPISVVGFGSKDAAIIGMLAQHGVDPQVGLTVTLLFLLCSYLVTLLLSGLSWWIKPLIVRRVSQ